MMLFTFLNTSDESLPPQTQRNVFVGDYITYNKKTYLVFDEFDHPDYADYSKHKIIECNVQYGYNNKKFGGFYMGSRRKLETLNEGRLAQSISLTQVGDSPLLIVGVQDDLKPRSRVMINGEAWMIDNIDKNTIPHIMFLTIHLDTITTSDDLITGVANSPEAAELEEGLLLGGQSLIIETNEGYIRFDTDVNIISQTMNQVEIIVPYDVNTLTITTKDAEGNLVVTTYEVA
jgi:hypothetical protein